MRTCLLLIFLLVFAMACDTSVNIKDPNDTHFIKFYGGDGDQTGADFVALPDGSFVLFGTTKPSGAGMTSDWYLVKTDQKGNIIWEKTFGTPNEDEARDIELTNDNRLVLVGNTYKTSTNRDILIMTVSLDGTLLKSASAPIYTTAGVDPGEDEDAASVTQLTDGFIVAGSTTLKTHAGSGPRDAINMRFNNDLTLYTLNGWPISQVNGYGQDEVSRKIFPLQDGTFAVFGYSNTPTPQQLVSNYNFWYFILGTTGTSSAAKIIGDQTEDERLNSVSMIPQALGGGYFLSGLTTNATGTQDFKISKLRQSLDFTNLFTPDVLYNSSLSIRLGTGLPETAQGFSNSNGNYYVLSNENAVSNNQDWVLTKGTLVDGLKLWTLPIVFGGEGLDTSGTVKDLPDGSVVMIGTMRTGKPDVGEFKMTLIKTNADGKLID